VFEEGAVSAASVFGGVGEDSQEVVVGRVCGKAPLIHREGDPADGGPAPGGVNLEWAEGIVGEVVLEV
jgi:hypothetical protein